MSTHGLPPLGDPTPAPAAPKLVKKGGRFSGKGPALIAALVFMVLAFVCGYFVYQSTVPQTVEVYQTTGAMVANQLLTEKDLTVVEMNAAEVPEQLLTAEDLKSHLYFAQVDLPAGTPVSKVVFDTATRTNIDLPANTVIASFTADPESAVAGRIQAGDYVNITAVGQLPGGSSDVARLILNHILILDVASGAKNQNVTAGQSVDDDKLAGPNNPGVYGGVPKLYTVAVTNEQAATLALARNKDLYVTLTSDKAVNDLNVTVTAEQVFGSGTVTPGPAPAPMTEATPAPSTTAAPTAPATGAPSSAPASSPAASSTPTSPAP